MKEIVLGGAPKRKATHAPPPRKRRRRRTGRQTLNYLLLLLVASAIMITLSLTVLFHVGTITTDGLTKYAPQALVDACGVKEGDNLLRVSERAVRRKILERFPYVEDVRLRRSLPDKLVLQITEAEILGACEMEGGYVIVGKTGRILETGASAVPGGAMEVYGMYMFEPSVGRILGHLTREQLDRLQKEKDEAKKAAQAEAEKAAKLGKLADSSEIAHAPLEEQSEQEREEEAFRTLSDLMTAVEETGFRNITMVDLSDGLNTAVVYDDRVLIELGSVADLNYKLNFVANVLENQLPAGYRGVVDASYCTTSKSVVTSAGDISEKIDLRRSRAMAEPDGEDGAGDASGGAREPGEESSGEAENPLFALKPKKETDSSSGSSSEGSASASGSSSGASPESEEESEASMIGPYTPDMLALKPGPAKPASSSGNSSSGSAPESASSGVSGAR